jgi:RNA polymerase sigma-70 factor, ECF subfamily
MAKEGDVGSAMLLSDQPTIELVIKARGGDAFALEALLQRSLPRLKRWAHGRLPAAARGHLDTNDLVQDAAINAIAQLDRFEPRHVGALQAYLRKSVINRIRDEVRRVGRRPVPTELTEDMLSAEATQQERVIRRQNYDRYRAALAQLRPKDRELILARVESQWTLAEVTQHFHFTTPAAARMAINRALDRLKKQIEAA